LPYELFCENIREFATCIGLHVVCEKIILQFQRKYTGWPKKVSHYRESSLNRIKNRKTG